MLDSSLSTRLQSENPFDEFREAVERAMIEKSKVVKKKFDYDKEFFGEKDDTNMCISMHQPWASLMVHGFKRFEGRAWTTKYRGPLWVHATSQKPDPDQIDMLESLYAEHYAQVGEDLPAFPTRYPTGVVIGRVDLVDVLSLEQYKDTVPEVLQEKTDSPYQFVIRNPQYLDMPLRMAGQPNIYKMVREIAFGARPLLKRVQYAWWPPKDYRLHTIGQFDLYPMERDPLKLARLLSSQNAADEAETRKKEVVKTNNGVFHVKGFLNVHYQQTVIHEIRELCSNEPHKFKFMRVTEPNPADLDREEYEDDDAKTVFVEKENCYSLDVASKEAPGAAKGIPMDLEGVVNTEGTTKHRKLWYKKYKYEFYRDDGYGKDLEKLHLKEEKKGKDTICGILVVIGNSVEIEYEIHEDGVDYTYKRVLDSGDAFFFDQKVKHFAYRVNTIKPESKPFDVTLRDGSLLLRYQKD